MSAGPEVLRDVLLYSMLRKPLMRYSEWDQPGGTFAVSSRNKDQGIEVKDNESHEMGTYMEGIEGAPCGSTKLDLYLYLELSGVKSFAHQGHGLHFVLSGWVHVLVGTQAL